MRQFDVALRQLAQSSAAHQREIDRRGERAQRMIGADVRGRAFAPNMLLASRERQAECAAAVAIASLADQSPRHLAQVRHSRGHETDAGPAELKRQAETLPFADRDIDAEFARRACSRPSAMPSAVAEIASAPARCVIVSDRAERLDHAERVGIAGDGAQQPIVRRFDRARRASVAPVASSNGTSTISIPLSALR